MSSLASAAITVKEKISTEEKSTIIRKKKKSKKRKGVKKKTLNSNVSSPTLDAADTDIDEDDTSVADDEVDLGISAELLLTASSDIAAAAKVPLTISKSVNSFEKAQVQISEQSQTFEASGDENEFIEQDEYDPKLEHQRCQSLKCLKKATESTTKKKESISAAPLTVRGVHLKTLRDIFDEKFHQISYAQFKSLWENLGGVIPDPENGGSHRSLYWNGRIVGRTYKPHGGHDYGYRCIKYLRIALEEIITDFISLTDERA